MKGEVAYEAQHMANRICKASGQRPRDCEVFVHIDIFILHESNNRWSRMGSQSATVQRLNVGDTAWRMVDKLYEYIRLVTYIRQTAFRIRISHYRIKEETVVGGPMSLLSI